MRRAEDNISALLFFTTLGIHNRHSMLNKVYRRKSFWVISLLLSATLLFLQCTNDQAKKNAPIPRVQYTRFAGAQACAACHKDIYDTHIHTAHFHTSEQSNDKNVKGSFDEGKNLFLFNEREFIAMEKHNDSLYQVHFFKGQAIRAQTFDINTGSGKRGQTYMYWDSNRLFQLPISYFTSLHQWTNSPGYSNRIAFRRPISSRCLECHSTYFQKISPEEEENEAFSRTAIIYGVDCEKCHGPGARHVEFQRTHPDEKTARFIVNTGKLTRERNLDMCRLCHGGRLSKTQPSFSFQAGDSLSGFFTIPPGPPDPNGIDVHGNQYGLLAASKCFRTSQMTCITCHDPHKNQEGMLSAFSAKCMSCHTPQHNNFCKWKEREKYDITSNCIDCHMPELTSRAIMVLLQGESIPTPASMRSHYIKVYPEQIEKFKTASKQKPL